MPVSSNLGGIGTNLPFQLGGVAGLVPPPFNPSGQPWSVAQVPGDPAAWRRTTRDSFARGPEFAQPNLDPSTVPFYPSSNSGEPPVWRRRTIDTWARGPELAQPNVNPATIAPLYVVSTREQDVTPPQRYLTLASTITPVFPSFGAPQQINLAGYGINHRGIGTPRLTGGAQSLQAFVSGVNESAYFLALSCSMTRQLGTSGTATVKFLVAAGGWVPTLGASITLIEYNRTVFSGIIDRRKYTVYAATSEVEYTAYCVDWNGLMQRHLVVQDFAADTLVNVCTGLMGSRSISADLISTAGVNTSLSIAEAFSFSYIKISDALTQMAESTNTIWWIDNYKVLHMILAAGATASAYSVAENGMQTDPDVTVEDSLANYRNTQYVRTSNEILSESVSLTDSHTFAGTAGDVVCITRYPFTSSPPSVLENGIEIVGTDRFFQLVVGGTTVYPPGGEGWYWAVGFFGVWHWPTTPVPVAGTTISVSYTGISTYAGNVVKYQDAAEVLRMQGIAGGSGVFEEIEDYSGSITYAQALALAQGIEQAAAPPPQTVTVSTVEPVEDIGYAVSVVLPRWALSGTYVIQQINRIHAGANLGYGTGFRTTIQLVSARTLGNFTQYFERLLARLNKNFVSAPTEKPSWDLAFDTPGNLSSGLVVGTFGAAWGVQVGLGRISYVSVLFETAADANIVIDILLNGATVFSTAAKATYTTAMTGTLELYANLDPTKINVTRGDKLTLSVLQCGAILPGKNGTVAVVITQR
jgi:hypothetical protein